LPKYAQNTALEGIWAGFGGIWSALVVVWWPVEGLSAGFAGVLAPILKLSYVPVEATVCGSSPPARLPHPVGTTTYPTLSFFLYGIPVGRML
tara:strand:- start:279 stop:554 length:276 start_codon:yes stop_codon:yes gene_type:complete